MSELDDALSRLHDHSGVRDVLLLGRDGLLVRHLGAGRAAEMETTAALIPALAHACGSVGGATDQGDFATAAIEFAEGVAVVVALSRDLLLAITLESSVGFGPLLHEVRRERSQLAALL